MTARADILAAIRGADVPAAPAAAPVRHDASGPLLPRFVAMLEQVGGVAVMRRDDQSLHETARALAAIDQSAVMVRGRFAVAENGAVYVDADDLGTRTDAVNVEHLILVVPREAIVATMHEAVRLIPAGSRCGWFLSGPSKTADIEQALVVGAQGARTVHVILEP